MKPRLRSVLFLLLPLLPFALSSELGAVVGDGAVSQLLRHAAQLLLSEQRTVDVLLASRTDPGLDPLSAIDVRSRIGYRNVSLRFHENAIRVRFDQLSILSTSNVSDVGWPMVGSDYQLDWHLEVPQGEVLLWIDPDTMSLHECSIDSAKVSVSSASHWLFDRSLSFLSSLFSPALDSSLCYLLNSNLQEVPHTNIMKFPVHSLLPEKAREFLAQNETNLFYRLKSVDIHEHQMTVRTAVEWNRVNASEDPFGASNTSAFEMELKGDDRVTLWVEDEVLNELINQVEWDFEWMSESVPVSSPLIPPDSREFLSTLCTQCYFLLNVWAKGNPTIQATNNSLIFEKRDRVNLRVVNPDRNVTSVFVSFVLTIQAELRPSFDNGILRTLVQLLDTNITMESGAFPRNWALFMQDLMRGMILDMMWPEIKNAIEELSYGKGVRVSKYCGLDPSQIEMDIGEGAFALTTRLALHQLDIEKCLRELKSAIPNTSKLFQKLEP